MSSAECRAIFETIFFQDVTVKVCYASVTKICNRPKPVKLQAGCTLSSFHYLSRRCCLKYSWRHTKHLGPRAIKKLTIGTLYYGELYRLNENWARAHFDIWPWWKQKVSKGQLDNFTRPVSKFYGFWQIYLFPINIYEKPSNQFDTGHTLDPARSSL